MTNELVQSKPNNVDIKTQEDDVVIYNKQYQIIQDIQLLPRKVKINEKIYDVNAYEIIRMIKRITQNIGEYKGQSNLFADIVVTSLRKARGDLVAILEEKFNISWKIDSISGKSQFFM